MLSRFREIIISSKEPDKHAFLGAPVVADEKKDHGPLMGIASAMKASNYDRNFVIACDIPNVDIAPDRGLDNINTKHDYLELTDGEWL